MENLTLEEINQLMVDGGYEVTFDSIRFHTTNASNEAVFMATVNGGPEEHVYIRDYEGTYRLSYNARVTDEGPWESTITHPEAPEPTKDYSV